MSHGSDGAAMEQVTTRCCVVGGGPAGMMLGLLLARAGVPVVVLEKHADFLRDFRGDTLHPSTLEVVRELGWLEALLARPHQRAREIGAQFGDTVVPMADFSHLPTACRFVAFMPQWDFLDLVAEQAQHFPGFALRMRAEATELLRDGDRVAGVRARTPAGGLEVRADLVVAADGRHSALRAQAGLRVLDQGAPIDVLWFRLPRGEGDATQSLGRVARGRLFVTIDRGDYWQCALVIRKGGFDAVRRAGLPAFRAEVARVAPGFAARLDGIADWDQVKLLSVSVDRLQDWCRPGLLCIGDAAHAMSPVGGVGINLAIQDAVAAANLLAPALRRGVPDLRDLRRVQRRREWPTRATQRLQRLVQDRLIGRVLAGGGGGGPPWPMRLLARLPVLRRVPARLIGMGFRPEHVAPGP
ncbi:FAD-dependent oxidoreductase [Roseomonas sp. BN140053]|uniref:FAD-dependent oxidoreductase n=1 Tax=Roseomonas sp. BN140053 TaxID=3391898 RepID=UPI0039EB646B